MQTDRQRDRLLYKNTYRHADRQIDISGHRGKVYH